MRKILRIKRALAQSNEKLLKLNEKLNAMNSQLNDTNSQLCEISNVKELILLNFLMYVSAILARWRNTRMYCISMLSTDTTKS